MHLASPPVGSGARACLRTLAITSVLAFTLLACGSTAGGAKDVRPVERPVQWAVASILSPRIIKLGASVQYCVGTPKPRLNGFRVMEGPRKIYVTALLAVQPQHASLEVCYDKILFVYRRLQLAEKLGHRQLYDASTSPPEQRWPLRD
jgi:hypothetical protein